MAAIGSFDSLNPYIVKGTPAAGLGMVFETLTTQSNDEAFSEYGLLAESIDMPEDRSWVAFELRPAGALARRPAGDRRRRDLQLRHPEDEGSAVLPGLLRQRGARPSATANGG